MLALLPMLVGALAQEPTLDLDPGVVPSAGVATEDGPGAMFVNPANLAYDPDQAWGLWYRHAPDSPYRHSGAATYGIGGVAGGFRWLQHVDRGPDFRLDLAASIKLPERVSVGGALRWNVLWDKQNFVGFDLAASYRPLPWIGVSVLTRNIGNPGGTTIALPSTGGGVAIRPVGRVLVLGADYLYRFGLDRPGHLVAVTARIRPARGLFLRTSFDSDLRFGAGVELYLGGVGGGIHAGSADYDGVPDITAWVGSDERDEHLAPPRQVAQLDLDEAPPYLPARRLLGRDDRSWLDTLDAFSQAEVTAGVRTMLVTLGDVSLPWARWQELRNGIRRLRARGKDVVVLLDGHPGNGALYAASAASRVLVHPAAEVRLTGLVDESIHVRGLLDTLGVGVEVVTRGEHKAAGEGLTRTGPSDADRAQREAVLDDVHAVLVSALAEGRAATAAQVEDWIDGGPWTAAEAVAQGLVDGRAYPDQAQRIAQELAGGKRVRVVDLSDRRPVRSPWDAPLQVAVVYVEGPIVRGLSRSGGLLSGPATGADTVVDQLDTARRSVAVRAVVLRVDSPGGSAFAADEIWRAVERVKAVGKPVVVSMGGVAASGGYWISAGADSIWAEPTTVTGSIGVIAMKPHVDGLADRLGVTTWRTTRGRVAAIESPWTPWDPLARSRVQRLVDATYDRFVDKVARGRGLEPDAAEAAADGRIWSGQAARDVGLVDQLGGLDEALLDARRLADIPAARSVEVVGLRERRTLGELLLGDVIGLATRARLGRIDRAAVRLATDGLLAGTPLEPMGTWFTLLGDGEDVTWAIDPTLATPVSR